MRFTRVKRRCRNQGRRSAQMPLEVHPLMQNSNNDDSDVGSPEK
jgi:hypothetical protein